jgi:phage gpG-like protein
MLEITYNQSTKLPALLNALSIREIDKALIRPTQGAAAYVMKNKLTKPPGVDWSIEGQMLGRVSGDLAKSLQPSVKAKNGVASFGTTQWYGADWELGQIKGKAKRPWLSKGTTEYVESGEFVRIFKEELLKALK